MGKNKAKTATRRAATAAAGPFPLREPATKPARDAIVTSTPPYSSDGPTLPIIASIISLSDSRHPHVSAENVGGEREERTRKKRKGNHGTPVSDTNGTKDKNHSETLDSSDKMPRKDLAPLYEPWTLLPPHIRKAIGKREGRWEERVAPVVYTRNQNIRAGINGLKTYLGAWQNPNVSEEERGRAERIQQGEVMVAVSAQGDAIPKLVSVIEMTKRVVRPSTPPTHSGSDSEPETWHTYTSLSSRTLERPAKQKPPVNKAEGDGEDEEAEGEDEEGAFESLQQVAERDREEEKRWMTVPVLTVWMSAKEVKEFREAFGEQMFRVHKVGEEG